MKSWEISKGIRKGVGGMDMSERVHRTNEEKGRSRSNLRRELDDEITGMDDDPVGVPRRLVGGEKHLSMVALKNEKGDSVIPEGDYCYGKGGNCPYWDLIPGKPRQEDGFCWFLLRGDWQGDSMNDGAGGIPDLWDQIKGCGRNEGGQE